MTDDEKAVLARIAEIAKSTQATLVVLITVTVTVVATLLDVKDRDFFHPDAHLTLPLVELRIGVRDFFVGGPALALAIYAYLHVMLIQLWRSVRTLPSRPDQFWSRRIHPGLITGLAIYLRKDSRHSLGRSIIAFLAFALIWLVPLAVPIATALKADLTRDVFVFNAAAWTLTVFTGICLSSFVMMITILNAKDNATVWRAIPSVVVGMVAGVAAYFTTTSGQSSEGQIRASFRAADFEGVSLVDNGSAWSRSEDARREFLSKYSGMSQREVVEELARQFRRYLPTYYLAWVEEADRIFWAQRRAAALLVPRASFISIDLKEANFRLSHAPYVDFLRSDLRRSDFQLAILEAAVFREANLYAADFDKAELQKANFQGAQLAGVTFELSGLTGANFSFWRRRKLPDWLLRYESRFLEHVQSKVFICDYEARSGIDRHGCRLPVDVGNLPGYAISLKPNLIDFENGTEIRDRHIVLTDLRGAIFESVDLAGADFTGAIILQAEFRDADLRRAKGLTPEMLDGALGTTETRLPPGLHIRLCFDEFDPIATEAALQWFDRPREVYEQAKRCEPTDQKFYPPKP